MTNNSPTEKQIVFVEQICNALGINDFPLCSKEFTKWHYNQFIKTYLEEYKTAITSSLLDEDWCYQLCINDVWCEHY